MKDEEFNNFLRERADSFELKPSSGSFAAVQRKMQRKDKRRGVIIFLSLFVATLVGAFFIFSTENTSNKVSTAGTNPISQQQTTTAPQNAIGKASPNAIEAADEQSSVLINAAENNSQSIAKVTQTANAQNKKQQTKPKSDTKSILALRPITQNTSNGDESTDADNNSIEQPKTIVTNEQEAIVADDNDNGSKSIDDDGEKAIKETLLAKEIEPENKTGTTTDSSGKKCNCANSKWGVKAFFNPFTAVYLNNSVNENDALASSNNNGGGSAPTSGVDEYTEELKAGWSVGLKAERVLSAKWKIGFGMGFTNWSIDQTHINTNYTKDSTENIGFDPFLNQNIVTGYTVYSLPNVRDSAKVNTTLHSIQLPVYANYTFATNKNWQFGINGGFTASYLFARKNTEVYEKQSPIIPSRDHFISSDNLWQTYRTFNINLNIGFNINYNINNCMGVYAEPTFGTSILSLQTNNNRVPARRPLFMGIETGVKINF